MEELQYLGEKYASRALASIANNQMHTYAPLGGESPISIIASNIRLAIDEALEIHAKKGS